MDLKEQLNLMQNMVMVQTMMMLQDLIEKRESSEQSALPKKIKPVVSSFSEPSSEPSSASSSVMSKSYSSLSQIQNKIGESVEDQDKKSDSTQSGESGSSNQDESDNFDNSEEETPSPYSSDNPWGLSTRENKVAKQATIPSNSVRSADSFAKESVGELPEGHPDKKFSVCGRMTIGLIGVRGTGKSSYIKVLSKIRFDPVKYESGALPVHHFSILVDFPGRYDSNGVMISIVRKRVILTLIDYPGCRDITIEKNLDGILLFGSSERVYGDIVTGRKVQQVISRSDLMDSTEVSRGSKSSRKNSPIYISSVTCTNLLAPLQKLIDDKFGKTTQVYFPVKI